MVTQQRSEWEKKRKKYLGDKQMERELVTELFWEERKNRPTVTTNVNKSFPWYLLDGEHVANVWRKKDVIRKTKFHIYVMLI